MPSMQPAGDLHNRDKVRQLLLDDEVTDIDLNLIANGIRALADELVEFKKIPMAWTVENSKELKAWGDRLKSENTLKRLLYYSCQVCKPSRSYIPDPLVTASADISSVREIVSNFLGPEELDLDIWFSFQQELGGHFSDALNHLHGRVYRELFAESRDILDQAHDPKTLKQSLDRLKARLSKLIEHDELSIREDRGGEPTVITGANLHLLDEVSYHHDVRLTPGSLSVGSIRVREIQDTYLNLRIGYFRLELDKILEPIDRGRITQLTKEFGGKGARLVLLKERLFDINQVLESSCKIVIPEFVNISAPIYRDWKKGLDVRGQLRSVYEKFKGKKILIRSSAVFSEDARDVPGAGIYETVVIDAESSFEDFYSAVETVFKSTDSELALKYRSELGIESEEMALVVQEFYDLGHSNGVSKKINTGHGFANSVLCNRPELMEVFVQEDGGKKVRPILNKKDLLDLKINLYSRPYDLRKQTYYNLDKHSFEHQTAWNLAAISQICERLFAYPQQIEFGLRGFEIGLFQSRDLPESFLEPANVTFPENQEPIWECSALGVCDEILDILPHSRDNVDRTGLVVYGSSTLGKNSGECPELYFPKSGVILVLCSPKNDYIDGHIETLAAAMGMTCLFTTLEDMDLPECCQETLQGLGSQWSLTAINEVRSLRGHTRVRVVSDGIVGRVYLIHDAATEL